MIKIWNKDLVVVLRCQDTTSFKNSMLSKICLYYFPLYGPFPIPFFLYLCIWFWILWLSFFTWYIVGPFNVPFFISASPFGFYYCPSLLDIFLHFCPFLTLFPIVVGHLRIIQHNKYIIIVFSILLDNILLVLLESCMSSRLTNNGTYGTILSVLFSYLILFWWFWQDQGGKHFVTVLISTPFPFPLYSSQYLPTLSTKFQQ